MHVVLTVSSGVKLNIIFGFLPLFVRSLRHPLPCGRDKFVIYEKGIIWVPQADV